MTEQQRHDIERVIERYFNASFGGNGREMLEVFHPAAHIYGLDEHGALTDWTVCDFVRRVESGTPPAAMGQAREDEILSIRLTGDKTAAAMVKLRLRHTRYTDILSFLHLDGQWRVIAKVLSAEKLAAQE